MQSIGPSRGGQTTKIHALTDVLGRPGVLLLTPGNASDVTTAPAVLAEAPGRVRRLAADKGYDADWLRADLREKGITPIIPGKHGRKRKIRHDKRRYRERWRIEATFNARQTCFCSVFRSATSASSRRRSEVESVKEMPLRIPADSQDGPQTETPHGLNRQGSTTSGQGGDARSMPDDAPIDS